MDDQLDNKAYLAFGANVGDAEASILSAWEMLGREPIIDLIALSHLYRTEPMGGPPGQEDYINAVGCVRTDLSARELLDRCLELERRLGRERRERWGPRTLDIDLLLSGGRHAAEPGLTVPHPRLRERLFVLVPLSDVAPAGLKLGPDGQTLQDVLSQVLEASSETLQDWRNRRIEHAPSI